MLMCALYAMQTHMLVCVMHGLVLMLVWEKPRHTHRHAATCTHWQHMHAHTQICKGIGDIAYDVVFMLSFTESMSLPTTVGSCFLVPHTYVCTLTHMCAHRSHALVY